MDNASRLSSVFPFSVMPGVGASWDFQAMLSLGKCSSDDSKTLHRRGLFMI